MGQILKADIAKRIYKDFDGYKCPGWKVKKHLWDKSYFPKIVVYDKNNYTKLTISKVKLRDRKIILRKKTFTF